jgi:co-chaperonin GroES (HSP10)
MDYKPVLDRILLKRVVNEADLFLGEGILKKAESYSESNRYEVVAVGDFVMFGGQKFPIEDFVSVGDVIFVSPYNIEEIELEGKKLQSCRVQDVRGKKIVSLRLAS